MNVQQKLLEGVRFLLHTAADRGDSDTSSKAEELLSLLPLAQSELSNIRVATVRKLMDAQSAVDDRAASAKLFISNRTETAVQIDPTSRADAEAKDKVDKAAIEANAAQDKAAIVTAALADADAKASADKAAVVGSGPDAVAERAAIDDAAAALKAAISSLMPAAPVTPAPAFQIPTIVSTSAPMPSSTTSGSTTGKR